ncbi:MAG: hypothetical protein QOI13_1722 [Paraburkholderia sp.]|nr:hypothetical protein [Paraburkholderia sp.]
MERPADEKRALMHGMGATHSRCYGDYCRVVDAKIVFELKTVDQCGAPRKPVTIHSINLRTLRLLRELHHLFARRETVEHPHGET